MVKLAAIRTGRLKKNNQLMLYKEVSVLFFKAYSKNREKRLLASSCPSVCLRGITRLPLDGF